MIHLTMPALLMAVLFLLLSPSASITAYAPEAPGDFDPTFGTNGIVETDLAGLKDDPEKVFVLPTGHILVGGSSQHLVNNVPRFEAAVVRYTAAGLLDATFGTNGQARVELFNVQTYFNDMAVLPDGKILLLLNAYDAYSNSRQLYLVRLQPNGAIDTSFGENGNLWASSDATSAAYDGYLAIGPQNLITVAYLHYRSIYVKQFKDDGVPNSNFGINGLVTVLRDNLYYVNHLTSLSDGSLSVGAYWESVRVGGWIGIRVLSDGSLDPWGSCAGEFWEVIEQYPGKLLCDPFSRLDMVTRSIDPTYHSNFRDLYPQYWAELKALTPAGDVVISCNALYPDPRGCIAQLLPNGSVDVRFGTNGIVFIDDPRFYSEIPDLATQPDFRIVGITARREEVNSNFVVFRLKNVTLTQAQWLPLILRR